MFAAQVSNISSHENHLFWTEPIDTKRFRDGSMRETVVPTITITFSVTSGDILTGIQIEIEFLLSFSNSADPLHFDG
jgi:hypothetical protein